MTEPITIARGMTNLQHYLHVKDVRTNTTAIINQDGHFRIIDGGLMPESEFQIKYKIPENPYGVRCNPDGTRVQKS